MSLIDNSKPGILPDHQIRNLFDEGCIKCDAFPDEGQIQPASLDLRLGKTAYRIRASFLPGANSCVVDKLVSMQMDELDLDGGAVLETGCVYLVPLQERLELPDTLLGFANPKSSTGRLDVFTRLITDYCDSFDTVASGYHGPLFAEICPQTFSIRVREGSRLNQLRFRAMGNEVPVDYEDLHAQSKLVDGEATFDHGLAIRVDLAGTGPGDLIGYRARRHSNLIDVDKVAACDVDEYWEPIFANKHKNLILDPDEFYILASKEAVHVPPDYAAEMVPFDARVGEFRVHYAGFFDPGFGNVDAGGAGSRAVLEIRSHKVPFVLDNAQIVGRLIYEPLTARPQSLYGKELGSNYQQQKLKLSKHFKSA